MSNGKNHLECKICPGLTRPIRDRQFNIDYHYCENCGFLFIDPTGIPNREQEKKRYLRHVNSPDDAGYVKMLENFIARAVTPFFPGFKTALDFGSGPGPVLAGLLKKMGADVDIYDIYFAPDRVHDNKTYDIITCTEVLEHLQDPLPVLNELRTHLNPGGILAVMTLFHPVGIPGGEDVFNTWWYRRDPTHISFFRPETFRYIADRLSFKIIAMDRKNSITLGV